MRIEKLRFLDDYKCIKKGTEIDFGTGNFCALVGLNGSGKSSVLNYLLNKLYGKNFGFDYDDDNNYECGYDYDAVIMDYLSTKNDILPKLVIHIYNGETKFGSRVAYNGNDKIYVLQLDSSIWLLASYILQLFGDALIDDKLKSQDVEELPNIKASNRDAFGREIMNQIGINADNVDFPLPKRQYIFKIIVSYICSNDNQDKKSGVWSVHSLNNPYLKDYYKHILQLSEGQKSRLVLQLVMKYLVKEEENTLVLLDEPDAYLDVQKKRDLFDMIRECKVQVIMTTHDPIMTKWMKGHLIFMGKGEQLSSKMVDTIKELSGGEVSYQETLLLLAECKYFVLVEGKNDVLWIKKAIEILGYTDKFKNVAFFIFDSAGKVKEKFENLINLYFPQNAEKILFLFDADEAGNDGKKQIDTIISNFEYSEKFDINKLKIQLRQQEKTLQVLKKRLNNCSETEKENIEYSVKSIKDQILTKKEIIDSYAQTEKINSYRINPKKTLVYLFYNHFSDFVANDNNKMDWFYLEDYMPTDLYKDEYKVHNADINNFFKEISTDISLIDVSPENIDEDVIRYSHLKAIAKRCDDITEQYGEIVEKCKEFIKKIQEKKIELNEISKNIKTQFEKINDYNRKENFVGFRSLLDKILEKLGLPNDPTS